MEVVLRWIALVSVGFLIGGLWAVAEKLRRPSLWMLFCAALVAGLALLAIGALR